jgi:RNA polymerase sigma factor (sigma-70 family)
MVIEVNAFKTLMRGALAGDAEAAERLCRDYQLPILRVVRRTLLRRLRVRYDSDDFVNDVWLSFFAHPPKDGRFEDPEAFIAYLTRMGRNKVGEVRRKGATQRADVRRETPLDAAAKATAVGALPAADATPSKIVGAEDEFERMLRDQPPAHRRILTLLRDGMSYREIAEHLHTNEKTIWRLIRRLDPEARLPCPPS